MEFRLFLYEPFEEPTKEDLHAQQFIAAVRLPKLAGSQVTLRCLCNYDFMKTLLTVPSKAPVTLRT